MFVGQFVLNTVHIREISLSKPWFRECELSWETRLKGQLSYAPILYTFLFFVDMVYICSTSCFVQSIQTWLWRYPSWLFLDIQVENFLIPLKLSSITSHKHMIHRPYFMHPIGYIFFIPNWVHIVCTQLGVWIMYPIG